MKVEQVLDKLNPQQRQAVEAGDGPVLVVAGPGSGKTHVLTCRVAYLLSIIGVRPEQIMAVTFTNKAAREMTNRIKILVDPIDFRDTRLGTFHAICARLLRYRAEYTPFSRDYLIYDTDDQLAVMKQAIADLNLDEKKNHPRAMLSRVSEAKNEMITAQEYPANDYRTEIVRRVYLRYDELLRANNARDFDDLLLHTVQMFREHDHVLQSYQHFCRYILVDEFQDTNMVQYELVRMLAGGYHNLFAVGDPDQSIYAFRGADFRNVQRFLQDYPEAQIIKLGQNYRSHQSILDAAMAVIDKNPNRIPNPLFTDRQQGPRLTMYEAYNEDDEARYVVDTISDLITTHQQNPGDFAIMYRTNAQSRALEDGFIRAGLPYRLIGATRFYARREIKDIVAYLRLIHNPDDNVSLQRIINVPPRGIGQKTVQDLEQWARSLDVTPVQALFLMGDNDGAPFSGRARNLLAGFAEQLREWQQRKDELPPADLLNLVLKQIDYTSYLEDGTPEGQSRVENVLELRTVAGDHTDLTGFLEEVSLISDVDTRDDNVQAPTLLTLHAAKGLEFPVVFIVGLEEGVLPHSRSIEEKQNDPSSQALDEERRLMYVGITRAEHRLYLIYAFRRSLYGDSRANMPSRFLYDLPDQLYDGASLRKKGAAEAQARDFTNMTRWERALSGSGRPSPAAAKPTSFKAGDVVWHSKYGEGIVSRSDWRGEMEEVEVLFPGGAGQKVIIAEYLKRVES